jgi:hypothetical protein
VTKKRVAHRNEPPVKGGQNEALWRTYSEVVRMNPDHQYVEPTI